MTHRVLLLTSNYPRWGGDSTTPFIAHLAADLTAAGCEVEVLAPHAPGAARHEVLDGITVHRFRYALPERAETVCYDGGALVNLRSRPAERLKLPVLVVAEWLATWWRSVRFRPTVIHAHWIVPQGLVARLAPASAAVVSTVHGGDIFGLQGPGMAPLKRFAARHSDVITVNSSATADAVTTLTGPLEHLRIVAMGTDVSEPDPSVVARLRHDHGGDGPIVMFVGRVVDEKGVEDLVRAVALIRASGRAMRSLVVGDGPDRPRLEALADELGISDAVAFLGWVEPAQVGSHLAAADVFVAPSRTGTDGWIEGQGLTVIEAMMAGTPVVATRSGGICDSIDDGITGLLVDERAPEQIAAAVERLVDDRSFADTVAEAARLDARSRFTRTGSAEAFVDAFDVAVARRRARRWLPRWRRP